LPRSRALRPRFQSADVRCPHWATVGAHAPWVVEQAPLTFDGHSVLLIHILPFANRFSTAGNSLLCVMPAAAIVDGGGGGDECEGRPRPGRRAGRDAPRRAASWTWRTCAMAGVGAVNGGLDGESYARAALTYLAEPADRWLNGLILVHGATRTLEAIRSGRSSWPTSATSSPTRCGCAAPPTCGSTACTRSRWSARGRRPPTAPTSRPSSPRQSRPGAGRCSPAAHRRQKSQPARTVRV
jgi:hypothetical protein